MLPLITNLVELATHMCAEAFFDPLPTLGHVFAVFIVPLAAMASLRALWRRDGERLEATMFAQAFATAIAAVYALIFAPLTPLALMAVPYMGMGILPLAPALSVFAGVRALLALRRLRIALGRPPRPPPGVGGAGRRRRPDDRAADPGHRDAHPGRGRRVRRRGDQPHRRPLAAPPRLARSDAARLLPARRPARPTSSAR